MHSIGEGGLVAQRRQQTELLPTNGGGASSSVHLGLMLVNSRAGQVSCHPSEGSHVKNMVFCRGVQSRGVNNHNGSHQGEVIS